MTRRSSPKIVTLALAAALPLCAAAQKAPANRMTIDASAPGEAPQPIAAKLGSATNPSGHTLAVNSQYLTLDGKPWIPVMGEFHFSRYPEDRWEQEILKMKAAGVNIISTYIIWIHHEQTQAQFNWTGQRDLRHFTELCARHGMYVYPRIGPWAHAEVRNGGLPDWVLKAGPTRQNDPVYLKEVDAFYKQIGAQLKGLYWKDGGPVIGLQVENEYRGGGPGKGSEHIRTLKQMAIAAGMDVPLYTVTGWDGAAIPLDSVLPVFGGYPDAPWDGSPRKLPPNEVYAFRFTNRSAGNMGAIGGRNQSPASVYRGTPFLTAEVGDGIQDTYFRRPVVSADDVAAIPPIMLGSGANLLGYYMFHGGRNPDGGDVTLQESQITNYPTDVPTRSYDFQAPLGEFGQARESLRKLKLVHYFLNDFGDQLAPMQPHAPDRQPATPADASLARVSARTQGDSGFVFVSNYVRGLDMPQRDGFQVELKLPSGTVQIPEQPITLPSAAYGIWPVNLPLTGASGASTMLRYSTAQLFKRVVNSGQTFYFFIAIPGIRPEFGFPKDTVVKTIEPTPTTRLQADKQRLLAAGSMAIRDFPQPGSTQDVRAFASADQVTWLSLPGDVHLVVLPQSQAENIWRVDNPALLVASAATVFSDGDTWTLQSDDRNRIDLSVFGREYELKGAPLVRQPSPSKLFTHWSTTLPAVHLTPTFTQTHAAAPVAAPRFGPTLSWRKNPIPLAPGDADFAQAAAWTLTVPPVPASSALSDAFLAIDYKGDAARLYQNNKVVDDNFWNGEQWTVGLRELEPATKFTLRVTPLAKTYGMYLEESPRLHFTNGIADSLTGVRIIPQYQLIVKAP